MEVFADTKLSTVAREPVLSSVLTDGEARHCLLEIFLRTDIKMIKKSATLRRPTPARIGSRFEPLGQLSGYRV
jgi:hypothetical protein